MEASVIRSQGLAILKFLKKLKIYQKWFEINSLELFAPNTSSFQVKKLSSRILVTYLGEIQFVWTNLDRGIGHKT